MLPDAATIRSSARLSPHWTGWLPLLVLPLGAVAARDLLPAWAFMWTLAFSIYAGFKWQSWREDHRDVSHPAWRSAVYLLAWPGMDARSFLDTGQSPAPASLSCWMWAFAKTAFGATILWALARMLPANFPLLRGWTGMLGALLLLHFGIFEIAALLWQGMGIHAPAIMNSPLRAVSLSEFWGKRWNLGFRQLAHQLVLGPLHKKIGAPAAGFLIFLLSGLLHDLVISLPARGGYGLPTLYFVLQGAGVAFERSRWGRRLGLREGFSGWLFMAMTTAAPAFWLFHPAFVMRVILPFMEAIHAL